MPTVVEEIPAPLQAATDAALAWINRERRSDFRLTGLVDPEEALSAADQGGPLRLGLVLCQGDVCLREQVIAERDGDGYRVRSADADDEVVPAHLDPPVGVRSGWLDEQLAKHAFVVLVFYRGFW